MCTGPAARDGAVTLLVRATTDLSHRDGVDAQAALLQSLSTLLVWQPALYLTTLCALSRLLPRPQALLSIDATRDEFTAKEGAHLLLAEVLARHKDAAPVVSRACRVAAAAASRCEDGKVALVKAGAAAALLDALRAHGDDAGVSAHACTALAALATPDDRRIAASSAFTHGRHLHSMDAHVAILAALQRHADSPRAVAAACHAVRAVAVNDEACEAMAAAGIVETGVQLLTRELLSGTAPTVVLRPALLMLRQLAGSDVVKLRYVSAGGLPPLLGILSASCALSAAATCEQALALCTALSLRQPDIVAAAAAAGAVDAVLDAMAAHPKSAGIQRAAAMFVRNCAARNPDVRPALLERGADALLRAAKKAHPGACADVGSAALRDLGAENYNEGWTPTTVYMGASGELYTYDELGGDDEDDGGMAAIKEED